MDSVILSKFKIHNCIKYWVTYYKILCKDIASGNNESRNSNSALSGDEKGCLLHLSSNGTVTVHSKCNLTAMVESRTCISLIILTTSLRAEIFYMILKLNPNHKKWLQGTYVHAKTSKILLLQHSKHIIDFFYCTRTALLWLAILLHLGNCDPSAVVTQCLWNTQQGKLYSTDSWQICQNVSLIDICCNGCCYVAFIPVFRMWCCFKNSFCMPDRAFSWYYLEQQLHNKQLLRLKRLPWTLYHIASVFVCVRRDS